MIPCGPIRSSGRFDKGCSFSLLGNGAASPPWRTALAVHPEDPELIFFSAGNKVNRLVRSATTWRAVYAGGDLHDDVHELMFDPQGNICSLRRTAACTPQPIAGKHGPKLPKAFQWRNAGMWPLLRHFLVYFRVCRTVVPFCTGPIRSVAPGSLCVVVTVWGVEFDAENDSPAYHADGNNTIVGDPGMVASTGIPARQRFRPGYYLTALAAHPVYPDLVLSGFHDLFISRDEGRSWTRHQGRFRAGSRSDHDRRCLGAFG